MNRFSMRPAPFVLAFSVACSPLYAQDAGQIAGAPLQMSIAAQPLAHALNEWARQTRIQLVVRQASVEGRNAAALSGRLSPRQALERLLAGSGLVGHFDGNLVTIKPAVADSGPGATLASVTVTAMAQPGDATEGTGSYTTRAVTIGKSAQALKDIPQSVSVITSQRIEDQGDMVLQDALANVTGITVQSTNMAGTSVYSRGFQIEDVQIDGQATMFNSNVYANYDLALYDRVEVLRGAAGLLQGAGQPGGAINLVRKKPAAVFGGTVAATAGSWNTYRAEADLTGPLNALGSLRGRVVAVEEDRGYFSKGADQKKTLLYGVAELDITSQTLARVGFHWQDTHEKPFYRGLPRYSDGSSLNLPRRVNLSADWGYRDIKNKALFAELEHRLENDWSLKFNAQHISGDSQYDHTYVSGAIAPGTGKGARMQRWSADNESRQKLLDVVAEGPFSLWGRSHHMTVGANYREHTYDYGSDSFSGWSPTIDDIFNWSPDGTARPGSQPLGVYTTQKTTQKGVFGSPRMRISDPLTLVLGARLSWYESAVVENWHGDLYPSYTKDSKVFTPYAALIHALNRDWSVYGSYADVFRTQSQIDASGRTLDPIVGANYEIGVKGALMDGKVNTSFALFRIEEKNRAQEDPNNPDPCPASPTGGPCYIADGKVRSQGFEAEITGQAGPGWMVAAGYTFNETTYLRDRDSNGQASGNEKQPVSTFTPKHMLRLWSSYRLPKELNKWSVAGGVNFQSSHYRTDGALRIAQAGYGVWNLRLAYDITPQWLLSLNVNNVTDKNYYQTLGTTRTGNYYGEPRNVALTLRGRF